MTAAIRYTVTYGLDADAYLTARAADRALEGHGIRAMVEKTKDGEDGVWLVERDDPIALGRWFLPGQQLIVTYDDGWRIEGTSMPAPDVKRTPEDWSAEYGFEIHDPDGWRHQDAPAWTEPITLVEFYSRAAESTINGILGASTMAAWERLTHDVKAAQA